MKHLSWIRNSSRDFPGIAPKRWRTSQCIAYLAKESSSVPPNKLYILKNRLANIAKTRIKHWKEEERKWKAIEHKQKPPSMLSGETLEESEAQICLASGIIGTAIVTQNTTVRSNSPQRAPTKSDRNYYFYSNKGSDRHRLAIGETHQAIRVSGVREWVNMPTPKSARVGNPPGNRLRFSALPQKSDAENTTRWAFRQVLGSRRINPPIALPRLPLLSSPLSRSLSLSLLQHEARRTGYLFPS